MTNVQDLIQNGCFAEINVGRTDTGGQWLIGIVIFQVQEPTGEDEYEVCDPDDSEC